MTKRKLQVAIDDNIDDTYSTSREIENGIVQEAILSVNLFLLAMVEICRGIEGPTRMR
jgi:hypothetical protein